MSIYNRRMFNNVPNNMRTNSRGVGITSGLVPVIKANQGTFIDSDEYKKLKAIADQIVPQQQGFLQETHRPYLIFLQEYLKQERVESPSLKVLVV